MTGGPKKAFTGRTDEKDLIPSTKGAE